MNIRELNKPVNSKTLNETLAKKFGTRLNVESFTLEQLQDARNKIRTKLSQIETNESYSGLPSNITYNKNKLFLDVLNAAIAERADVMEKKAKPDYIDIDGDGDKKEPMKKAVQDKKKKKVGESEVSELNMIDKEMGASGNVATMKDPVVMLVMQAYKDSLAKGDKASAAVFKKELAKRGVQVGEQPGQGNTLDKIDTSAPRPGKTPAPDAPEDALDAPRGAQQLPGHYDDPDGSIRGRLRKMAGESIIREGEEDKAELVMAAKDMVDRLTGWMEDTAEMQSESMLELADAIRDEMGQQESDGFVNTVKPALEQLYAAMESTRQSLTSGVGMLTGEGGAPDMGEEIPADEGEAGAADLEPTVDQEAPADEFAASAPAAGGEAEAGRAKRESIERSRRIGTILSSRNVVIR